VDSDALGDFWECTDPGARVTLGAGASYDDTVPATLFGSVPDGASTFEPNDKLLGAVLGYWRVVGFEMKAGARTVRSFKRTPVFSPVPLSVIDPSLQTIDTRIDDDGNVVRNTNPVLRDVVVHEGDPDGDVVTTLKKGGVYYLEPRIDEATLEAYASLKVDLDGLDLADTASIKNLPPAEILRRFTRVDRCEIPVFSWYATTGRFTRETTVDERVVDTRFAAGECAAVEGERRRPEVELTAPSGETDSPEDVVPADGVIHAFVVLRDGRGGTAFQEFTLTLGDAP
jgi:hypothetical protein